MDGLVSVFLELLFRFLFGIVSMGDVTVARGDDRLVVDLLVGSVAMGEAHVVDRGAGIGPGEHEAHLTDHAVNDVRALLLELVCVDGQRRNVAMLDQFLGILPGRSGVERAVGVDTVAALLQIRMTQDVVRRIVHMLPYQRHGCPVAIAEGTRTNGTTVRTT